VALAAAALNVNDIYTDGTDLWVVLDEVMGERVLPFRWLEMDAEKARRDL
jgi:hypothetical protein